MAINYKKELEVAAKNMILVHEPDTLIKMIVRIIVHKLKVSHAGILLHHKQKDSYILTVSRGPKGLKVPAGFARMDKDNPLIQFFLRPEARMLFSKGVFSCTQAKKVLKKRLRPELKDLIKKAMYQMEMFEAVTCIPSYFRNELLGLLLLGKSKNSKDFVREELDFFIALASDVAMALRNAQLFSELESELNKKQRLFINTTLALAAAIDAKDHYTRGHTSRVTSLSLEIAKILGKKDKKTFTPEFFEQLNIAGLLHDIGKIGIPESILNKNGPLDNEEWKKMREHPAVGAAILEPIKELQDAILGVKYHHERYDGAGYPQALRADEIPLVAAIISVADAFDAMTTDRPYRHALSREQAAEEIRIGSGKQFSPRIVEAFLELSNEIKL